MWNIALEISYICVCTVEKSTEPVRNCSQNKLNMDVVKAVPDLSTMENAVTIKENENSSTEFRHKRQRKDFLSLVKNIMKDSDNQAYLTYDEGNLTTFSVTLTPNDGVYAYHSFKFKVDMPEEYPRVAPKIKCGTYVYHPNIDGYGDICLSLFDDWCGEVNDLRDCVMGLLFLFHHPNIDDPLTEHFNEYGELTEEEFHKYVKESLAKKEMEDVVLNLDNCHV